MLPSYFNNTTTTRKGVKVESSDFYQCHTPTFWLRCACLKIKGWIAGNIYYLKACIKAKRICLLFWSFVCFYQCHTPTFWLRCACLKIKGWIAGNIYYLKACIKAKRICLLFWSFVCGVCVYVCVRACVRACVYCPYRYSSQKNKTFKVLLLTHCREPITVNSEYPDQIPYCSVSDLGLLLPLWKSVIVLCFVVRYFMSILVLKSS